MTTAESGSPNGNALSTLVDELLALSTAPERLASLLQAGAGPRAFEIVPERVVRLATSLASTPHYDALVKSHPELTGSLADARAFVLAALPGIALAAAVAPPGNPHVSDDVSRVTDFVRSLGSVAHANVWLGRRDALVPAVRVVVTDAAGDAAFDAVIDWSDLAFLAESLLTVLQESMTESAELIGADAVRGFVDAVPSTAERIRAATDGILDLAARLAPKDDRSHGD